MGFPKEKLVLAEQNKNFAEVLIRSGEKPQRSSLNGPTQNDETGKSGDESGLNLRRTARVGVGWNGC